MRPEDEAALRQWQGRLNNPFQISLQRSAHPASPDFEGFGHALSGRFPNVRVVSETEEGNQAPFFRIHPRIRYRIVPEGQELSPFLEALEWIAEGDVPSFDAVMNERLRSLNVPAMFTLFVAASCPHCPKAVRQMVSLCLNSEWIRLDIVDAFRFATAADSIQSVPTLVLEGGFRWSGPLDLQEVIDAAINRDPQRIGAASLENLVSDGQAARIAEIMLMHRCILPAFIDLLVHPQWQIRLGAMVAVETLVVEAPALARSLADMLWPRFAGSDDRIKGDILYVMGEIGAVSHRAQVIAALQNEKDPEVVEAAQEALDRMSDG